MSSGHRDSGRLRFNLPESDSNAGPMFVSATQSSPTQLTRDERLDAAIAQTRDYLLAKQSEEGYWVGELEGDTILESEYILLLAFLDREKSEIATQAANYILEKQLPEGGWASYPGGPLEISVSVKAYFALKLTGHSADAESMQRARSAILEAGGAEKINSFTRYYLALLGVIRYEQCPAVPPELILIPNWMPFNIYEMSAWSRTIVVPLSLLWAFRPVRPIGAQQSIREIFVDEPEKLPMCMGASGVLDEMPRKTWIDWNRFFNRLDRFLKYLERCRLRPFRKLAVRRAADWILERFENSDGLGAIFPPIIWSVIALKCLGYDDDSPEVQSALGELEKLTIREGNTARLEPCKSPVWDTALTTLALRDADLPVDHPAVRRAVGWLLSKEVRRKGDWSQLKNKTDVGGWYFEFHNEFYPDLDDTSMVVMALCRALPAAGQAGWTAELLLDDWSPHEAGKESAAILSTQDATAQSACRDVEMLTPQLMAIRRGVRWILAMQSSDGGWGAFDADNNRELFTQVPFADHNAMIDPSTADLTARMLEMFSFVNIPENHPALQHARNFVWNEQEQDGCWSGRWGVNYLYGTWQSLVGLIRNGVPVTDPRIQKAANWLKSKQQPSGAWGESPRSYDDPTLRGQGEPTASQTAWALIGLMAAGETDSPAVRRGIQYLLETQCEDGSWNEEWFTGTGFPRVFYLKYHLYRVYFPLMALSRYARLRSAEE